MNFAVKNFGARFMLQSIFHCKIHIALQISVHSFSVSLQYELCSSYFFTYAFNVLKQPCFRIF
ncbi:hypothetical protein LguiB_001528 [Lonicera macranthoides]